MLSLTWVAISLLTISKPALALPQRQLEVRDDYGGHHEAPFFYKGHDLSSLTILEEGDPPTIFKDTARFNRTRPAEDILGDGGMNTVRLRLWVHPEDWPDQTWQTPTGYNLEYTIKLAKRFSQKGYRIYLDYHFSDTWADPQKQYPPVSWPSNLPGLAKTIRAYVKDTLVAFKNSGVDLALVSLGNEIRHGMLWPYGYVEVDTQPTTARVQNFTGLATLWAASREGVDDAVRAGVKKPDVMIHVDNGWNKTLQLNWYQALLGTGKVKTSDWDVIGVSMYPFYGVNATLKNLDGSLRALAAEYQKPIQVVETDWPAICDGETAPPLSEPSFAVNPQGQIDWVHAIAKIVKQLPNQLGQGIHYWEPTWLNNTGLGSACQDAILFAGDWSGWPNVTIGYSRPSANLFLGI